MKLTFGFGHTVQEAEVPEENLLGILLPNKAEHPYTGAEAVKKALEAPVGTPRLRDIVHPKEKIAVITSDITRPMPTAKVMPFILAELREAGCDMADVTLVFALGSHRAHTEEERRRLAGEEAYSAVRCVDSDPSDCVHLGYTKAGTPVDVTRVVAEADRRICLGNVEYHYFVGYSGGAKAIMPGVSTRAAIQANHKRMTDENACAGRLQGNPIRADIEEAAAICGVDFILNVVLDEHKEIVFASAGDVTAAHRVCCGFLDRLYKIPLREKADIVLVSQGGAPKDLNLYQTQKALDNAKHAVKDGGTIILIGSCREGLGESHFEEWMLGAERPSDLVERIGREFVLGGHKAAAIAMVMQKAEVYLVSELPEDFVRRIFFTPAKSAQEAFDLAFAKAGRNATVLAMPYGGSTLPCSE